MAQSKYLTAPSQEETKIPGGIPYIVGNEAAERFSFYGMKTILLIFMTEHLLAADGTLAAVSTEKATEWIHTFVFWTYFLPILGAIISDAFWGKYRTIMTLSIVYCLGHLALAVDHMIAPSLTSVMGNLGFSAEGMPWGLLLGLALIAIGAGGIKPCVSAHVGDQFGKGNQYMLPKIFSWFYFSINFGAFASTMLTPVLLDKYGSHVAFGVPGILMFIATVVFWIGRNKYIHVPAGGIESIKEAFSGEGLRAIGKLSIIYVFVAVFWSLFDQTASKWVAQAKVMDRRWEVAAWFPSSWNAESWLPERIASFEWLPSQIQAVNPILILIFIPLFTYVVYPLMNRLFTLTPLRKVSIGFFLTVIPFVICGWIETQITAGEKPDIIWQFLAYVALTAAEVMVSITCLEFSYTQAPRKMKSFIMSLFLLSVALGNLFTAGVNRFIQNDDGTSKLEGADYYWFFSEIMLVAAVVFIVVAKLYRGKTYIQDEDAKQEHPAGEIDSESTTG